MENFDSPDKSSDKTKTSYNLSAFKQLIDLNGDSVNFEVFFTVKCDNEDDVFDMLVIDQENLDKNQVLKYKKITDGGISGKVKANTNTYLNYFLILKSENECPVTVEISKRELDESEIEYTQEPEEQEEQLEHPQEQLEPQQIPTTYPVIHPQEKPSINWKKVIIVCVIVSTGLGLYFYFTKTKKDEKEPSKRLEKSSRSSHFSPEHKSNYDNKVLEHKTLDHKSSEHKAYKEKPIPSFQVKSEESSSMSNYKSFIPPVIKKQEITSVRSSDTSSSKQVEVSSLIQRLKNARKNRK